MTDFLIKKYIKNYTAVANSSVRAAYGTLAGAVGILLNLLLFAAKFLIGTLAHSVSVTADAFNNLSDVASSVISLVGAHIAKQPPDKEHPYGHGRVEYLAAFVVAFLVLQMGLVLFKQSLQKLLHPEPLFFSWISMLVLLLSVACKHWLGAFNGKLGKRINSEVLCASAQDARSDAMATAATAASLLFFHVFGLNVDGAIGLLVSLFVLRAGIGIAKDTLLPIIGGPLDPAFCGELTAYIEKFHGVLGTHDLLVHSYGPTVYFASIHVEVSDAVSFDDAHLLMDRIERAVGKKFHIHLVTHADPVDLSDPRIKDVQKALREVVAAEHDDRLSFHDVRLVNASGGLTNVVFDLVVPWGYTREKRQEIIERIKERLLLRNQNWRPVVTIDHSFEEEK